MCGIIGYVGHRPALPVLLAGLKKLEYRGYDSSGVAVLTGDQGVLVRKAPGKIRVLEDELEKCKMPAGNLGVSHTRWATHGEPTRANAHPHQDPDKKIAVVHNGIIENYEDLRGRLQKAGHTFLSQTDTEVIPHLIAGYYKGDLAEAVRRAIGRLKGAFALGVVHADHPDTLVAARVGSPLVIGVGKGENFIASDVPAILEFTREVVYLQDGQMAVLAKDKVEIFTFAGKACPRKVDRVAFSPQDAQKQGYDHFMMKEIHEQPGVISRMMKSRLKGGTVSLDGIGLTDRQLKGVKHIYIVACGTAYHAGMVGKYLIEKFARVPVTVDAASEFRYRDPILRKNTLLVSISQSGETADTLAAVKDARRNGARAVTICNVVGSSLVRESDGVLYTHAGPEIGVASTKAYTAQIAMLCLFALKLGEAHGALSAKERGAVVRDLKKIPRLFEQILADKSQVKRIAREKFRFGCFLFLGRNINFPSALEGALKLKEISYIPAEGYAAGEMKHGPIALIDEYRAVVCVAPRSETYDKMISNMQEIRARKGKITAIATEGDRSIARHADYVIFIPPVTAVLTPLLVALPLQLIAYYIAVNLKCDVDQPRNLAKSVTVE
jgi:glucosamine--fructose-6-phosphate aminotransferase (isomerizing)